MGLGILSSYVSIILGATDLTPKPNPQIYFPFHFILVIHWGLPECMFLNESLVMTPPSFSSSIFAQGSLFPPLALQTNYPMN